MWMDRIFANIDYRAWLIMLLRQSRRGGLVCATDLKLDFCYRPFATTHTEILNVHFQVSAQPVDARAVGDGNLHKEAET